MSQQTPGVRLEVVVLAADVRAVLAANVNATDSVLVKARQRLAAALDSGEQINGVRFAEKESATVEVGGQVVCEHPFEGRYSGVS